MGQPKVSQFSVSQYLLVCTYLYFDSSAIKPTLFSSAKTAAYTVGIPSVSDFNDPSVPAISTWDVDVLQTPSRKRVSVFSAFLPGHVAEARKKHLKICPETLVQRVVFQRGSGNGERPRAVGVEFRSANAKKSGKVLFAKARKEVIVCCGAMGSPQVLMLR